MAVIGATITVSMLLFDPFLQQVVIYPDRLIPSKDTATIVRAQKYEARSEEGLPLSSVVDLSMKVHLLMIVSLTPLNKMPGSYLQWHI